MVEAFEQIVGKYLSLQGYWVKHTVRLNMSPEEKAVLTSEVPDARKRSRPRPEVDLVAFSPKKNELLVVEVKSFFNSAGVDFLSLNNHGSKHGDRYKLFNNDRYRDVILSRLKEQLSQEGLVIDGVRLNVCLAVGHFKSLDDEEKTRAMFQMKGWVLFAPGELKKFFEDLATTNYEDDELIVLSKLLHNN